MSAEWIHVAESDIWTLEGGMWYARISPHSSKRNGDVAFYILEIKNSLQQTKKHAHFNTIEEAKAEGEREILGTESPKFLYAVNV